MSGKKSITVITRDNIRKLSPHEANVQQRSKRAVVLNPKELEQIKSFANDTSAFQKESDSSKDLKTDLAKQRKEKMAHYDQIRAKNAKLSELDRETKEKANYLLAKAQMQIEEQEDEIKHLNELMLYAKCVSIRDKQVEQKKFIARQRKEEDLRLDAIMEHERVADLIKIEEREKARVEEMKKGAAIIRAQIAERREASLLNQERRDQETKAILKKIADTIEQEKKEKAAKVAIQKKLMIAVNQANEKSKEMKKLEKQKDLEEDLKVLRYLAEKEKKDEEKDRIEMEKKAERERELARLRAMQEKMADKQAENDALRAKRATENYEREWRKKEKAALEKQARLEREIRDARAQQQHDKEVAIAEESQKVKQQFFETLKKNKETEAKLKAEEALRHESNRKYALEVQAQIREKEQVRRAAREEFFLEGVKNAKVRQEKKTKIDAIKERKIMELRAIGVPTKYCNEVERQSHAVKAMFSK